MSWRRFNTLLAGLALYDSGWSRVLDKDGEQGSQWVPNEERTVEESMTMMKTVFGG